jgi:hypothetical protein
VDTMAACSSGDAGQLAAKRQDRDAVRGVGQRRLTERGRVGDHQAAVGVGG